MPAQRIDLPQGTLDLLILRTLSLGPQHGWATDCGRIVPDACIADSSACSSSSNAGARSWRNA
jgi:hypothetical protein